MKKISIKQVLSSLALSSSLLAATSTMASQADLDAEVNAAISEFNQISQIAASSTKDVRKRTRPFVEHSIKWSGITDARLFDAISESLLSLYLVDTSGNGIEYNAWLAKALAFSGQPKYEATLNKVASTSSNKKLKKHINSALKALPKYTRWNPVISKGLADVPSDQIHKQRVINMLQAEDFELVRAGAGHAFKEFNQDPAILNIVKKQLLANYKDARDKDRISDSMSWLCKILGSSGDPQYLPVLQEVMSNTSSRGLKKWAKKSVAMLD